MRFGNWESRVLLVCSLLLLDLGLIILLTRRTDVTYEQVSRVYNPLRWLHEGSPESSDLPEYLFCLPLKGEFDVLSNLNRTEIDLDELDDVLLTYFQSEEFKNERREKLLPHLHNERDRSKLRSEIGYLPNRHAFQSLILAQLMNSNFYIMNEKICFVQRDHSDFKYKAKALRPFFVNDSLFVYKRSTQNLFEMSSPDQTFNEVVVADLESPYSDCSKSFTRNRRLNECFRTRKWLSRYFYDGNETGSIVLDWTDEEQFTKEHEMHCIDNHGGDGCKSTYFFPAVSRYESTITSYIASPLIASADFWLQLIALLLPVVAILLFQFSTKLIERRAFQVAVLFTCLLCGLLVFSALYRQSNPPVDDCEETPKVPTKKQISFRLLEPEPFSLIICVGVGNILQSDYRFLSIAHRSYSEDFRKEFNRFYQNKTFAELEQETETGFEETVEQVYLQFLDRTDEVDWTLSPRVLFLTNHLKTLSRCYQVDVKPREPAYRSMLGTTRLVVKFKHSEYLFSLLPRGTSPTYQNLEFDLISFRRIEKHSKSDDCLDYPQLHPDCGSQQSCVEACVSRELLDRSGRILETALIDKAHYNTSQWNETKIEGFVANRRIPKNIKKLCQSRFEQPDCFSTAFVKKEKESLWWKFKETNLYYDLAKEFEEDSSPPGLLSSLLIVQGIFLVLNLLRLAAVVGFLKFKVRKVRLFSNLIYAACLIGLFVHLVCAFRAAMNSEPVLSEHYESPSSMPMNDAVFCFGPIKPAEENSSLTMATNSTANRTESELRDRANLRMIIREEEEEEMETENETENEEENRNEGNTTESLEVSKFGNATVDLNDEDDLDFNATRNGTEQAITHNETSYNELVTDNVTETSSSFNLTDENPTVDDTVRLTGGLLEEWTSDLTPETVFEKISYIDKPSGEWNTLDFSADNDTDYTTPSSSSSGLLIDTFYYQNRKCFAISTRAEFGYTRHQFAFLQQQNTEVLRVQLRESFKMEQNLTLSIAMKRPFSMQFDSLFDGLYLRTKYGENEFRDKIYAISQRELVQLAYEDHFYWVNPLVFLFQGEPDLNHYFMRLREAFKAKYQSTTLNLPLQEEEFDLSINDTLFEQFYEEYVRENGPPIDREHPEMEFAVNEMETNNRQSDYEYDVTFSLAFLTKVIKQSNAGVYLEFVAYLLNALLVLVVIGLFDLLIHHIC